MKAILVTIGLAIVILLAIAVGAALIVLMAAGLGLLLSRFLPLSAYEASFMSLIALITLLAAVWQILRTPAITVPVDEEDWEDEEMTEEDEPPSRPAFISSIPRWRQPLKRTGYESIGRNDPCPCGSGKKYKNCHGKAA
jgi:hypothetical protein